MSIIEYAWATLQNNIEFAFGAVGALILVLIKIRYSEIKTRREKFEKEYSEFKQLFIHFIENCLKREDVSLNMSFLGVFNEHERAKNIFIHNLQGLCQRNRLSLFNRKWEEYEEEYNDIKQHGVFAVAMAIAPTEEALRNAKPGDARKWENDRKNNLHNIILSLLEISKRKIWY